ncbi:FAD-dependent oxidoreductase [Nocardioides sp. YIM 152315]|nr:FAD-dependent oxidoreductase [Nocardioides sp. YIM 152315]
MSADVLIVGFGKGGKTVAHAAADAGHRVIMIEQSADMYGGTCPNVGCVPTKMLVHFSGNKRASDDAQDYFENSIESVRKLTSAFRAGNYEGLDSKETATVVTGRAVFMDPHTVRVGEGAEAVDLTAPTILVNTGSEPVIPPIPGLKSSSHLVSSTELTRTNALPERLIVLGGGYLGLEFASMYQNFGTEVTVIEVNERLLQGEDEDVAASVTHTLVGEGVQVITGARITEVHDKGAVSAVTYVKDGETRTVEGSALLPATGRRAVTADLRLDAAGVQTTTTGAIEVDEYLRTSQHHIFALGDVNGGPQFTYVALDDARIVIDQLFGDGKRTTTDRVAVPRTLFVSPPLATVGLSESEARARGFAVTVAREKVADIIAMPRAYAVEETRGLMKFIVDADSDLILGAALHSVDSQEIVNTVALAIRHNVTATELRNAIYTHPSSTEAMNEVFDMVV